MAKWGKETKLVIGTLIAVFGMALIGQSTEMFEGLNMTNNSITNASNVSSVIFCLTADSCIRTWPAGGAGVNYWQVFGNWMSPNTTSGGKEDLNVSKLNTTTITATDWSNVSITESQISDLTHQSGNTTLQIFGICDNGTFYPYSNPYQYVNLTWSNSTYNSTYNTGIGNNTHRFFDFLGTNSLTLGFANLTSYPAACAAGSFVSTIGDTSTCTAPTEYSNSTYNLTYNYYQNDSHTNFTQDWEGLVNYPSPCPTGTAVTTIGDASICTAFNQNNTNVLYNEIELATNKYIGWWSGGARKSYILGSDGSLDLDIYAGDNLGLESENIMEFKASGDTNDYITFSSDGAQPNINCVGCNLELTSDLGQVSFNDDDIYTTGDGYFTNNIAIGSSTVPTNRMEVVGASSSIAGLRVQAYSTTDAEYPQWIASRSNSNTVGELKTTDNLNYLGGFFFRGVRIGDGAFANGGVVLIVQDGAAMAARVPGRMVLGVYATPDQSLHYIHIKPDKTTRFSGNVTIGSDTASSYPLEVTTTDPSGISLYLAGNGSAVGWNVRSSVFDKNKDVWDYIKDAGYYVDNGELNHSKFYGYTGTSIGHDYDNPTYINNTICEDADCKDPTIMTETVYPEIEVEHISLGAEIDVLRQAAYELNARLTLMEAETCIRDPTYSWCGGKP